MNPFLILGCGVAIVVGGVLWLRWHPFVALLLAAIVVAVCTPEIRLREYAEYRVDRGEWTSGAGEKWIKKSAPARVAEEFGRTCGNLGILIAMAALIGEGMLRSGAAATLAERMLSWTGKDQAHWAFFGSSFVLCIPVMLDTVMYLLAPLYREVARRTERNYLLLILCTVAGGTITHSLVPPTPGPLFVAAELGVPMGLMIGMGTAIGLGAALSGVAFATWVNRTSPISGPPQDVFPVHGTSSSTTRPSFGLAILPVVLPLLLIGLESWMGAALRNTDGILRMMGQGLRFLGDKDFAVTLGALAALIPLVGQTRSEDLGKTMQAAFTSAGVILLIIASGGAFGGVLQQTGIGKSLATGLSGAEMFALPMVFLITALVRTAQGSATVAMITAAPIAKALLAGGAGIHPVYFALAIGCGSKPIPWMNDAGFWIIARVSQLTESQALRTVTPMMSLQGVAGLVLTMLSAWMFPLR